MSDPKPFEPDDEARESLPNAGGREGLAGEMGVSSERLGHAGPGQSANTDGTRPTLTPDDPAAGEAPPEQATGGPEFNTMPGTDESRGGDA